MLTKLTAYIIATREDINITCAGPAENGKWAGWITLGPEDRYRPLLNTEPIYETAEEAKQAMRDAVDEIKRAVQEETGGKHPIDHVMGSGPEAEAVKMIVAGVRAMRSSG